MNTVASPCPGPGLFCRHRNGMSLVVMRFLTLGSTLSIPNQLPKIISTGNAFLTSETKKNNNKFPQMMSYLFILRERVFGSSKLWFRCYKLAQDAPKDFFLKWRKGERRARGWPIFPESVFSRYSMKRGSHKRLMRRRQERGGWGGGQGQMSHSQKEKHIAFHQPAEKEVIHNSVDTIQPRMYALGVRCDHAATSRQVKKRKKCHFPPAI